MTHNLQDSIGTIDSEKGLQFPKLSISGQPFSHDQTRVRINKHQFVVLDRFLDGASRDEWLAKYRSYKSNEPKKVKPSEPPAPPSDTTQE